MLLEELRKRSEFINEKQHDTLPLILWNYNNKCAINDGWDKYTELARGLITDLQGNMIARPFKKFFNLNQRPQDSIENLPITIPTIYEKLDGSLGILYFDGNKPCIATRGSFNSNQAIWATQWIQNKGYIRKDFNSKYTYLVEILYKQNRIVINYGDREELVLLAIINTQTGEEGDYIIEAKRLDLSYAKVYNKQLNELIELVKTLPGDDEGFVIKYPNNYRIKLKGIEYLRLHRLLTGFSTKSIWECLMNGDSFDEVLTNIPDEFFEWIMIKKKELEDKFIEIQKECMNIFDTAVRLTDRKNQAIYLMIEHKNIASIVFAILDRKDYKKQIWKQLKPVYELPFFNQSKEEE